MMGRPPVALCVVRHGNRLDAADKRWHLTSPTPYDPPLTYGGWLQAKALGIRIAEHLRQEIEEREKDPSRPPSLDSEPKRYQIVIHSSPFLRCIQTSIAISAGLAQNPLPVSSSSTTLSPMLGPSHTGRVLMPKAVTNLSQVRPPPSIQKTILRLDACFGEWLSPEYFEMITHPPSSMMMLGSAKAELLRREDYHNYPHFHLHTRSSSSTQLWEPPSSSSTSLEKNSLDDLAPLGKNLPNNDKSENLSSRKSQPFLPYQEENVGYVPPTLGYSTSHNAPIPMGLVAHAKDQCVDVDYQWDSMREPLSWGDGGSFGEEWTAMHKRFRKGLQSLVDWYATAENPGEMVTKTVAPPKIFANDMSECAIEDPDDMETETFVIVVSHGAGCNAMIGAITRKPVLMDVGLASLTLAVRKDSKMRSTKAVNETEEASIAINELYDLRLFANTEHIRPSTGNTPNSSRSPSMANALSGARGRFTSGSFSSLANNFSLLDGSNGSRSSSANGTIGNFRRGSNLSSSIPRTSSIGNSGLGGGITVGSGVTSFTRNAMTPSGLSRHPSVGLWSPLQSSGGDDINDDDGEGLVLNFSHEKTVPHKETKETPNSKTNEKQAKQPLEASAPPSFHITEEATHKSQLGLGAGAGGLWGSPTLRPPGEAELLRDLSTHKRRWTVNERTTS